MDFILALRPVSVQSVTSVDFKNAIMPYDDFVFFLCVFVMYSMALRLIEVLG